MMMANCKLNRYIQRYIDMIETGEVLSCKEQKLLVKYVKHCFEIEEIYTDDVQLEKYLGLVQYFPFEKLYEWEEFIIALHLCTYWKETGLPRWPDLFLLCGRGSGKDGFIAFESVCLVSPHNGIKEYDIDICANNEDQALRPVKDIVAAFDEPKHSKKLKKFFYWLTEKVTCTKTKSTILGRTNSPKGKDGLRSGAVMFNEIHQYENYDNIDVFTTGLGKKKHPRRGYFTTQGDVREGPLDDLLDTSEEILEQREEDNGLLPVIFKLDNKEEVHNEKNWEKANPSLRYSISLLQEIRKEYKEWVKSPRRLPAFMTKRMNIPDTINEQAVTKWKNIEATNREIPDLKGWTCSVGIDYAMLSDFAGLNFHFKKGNMRYDINYAWLCRQSKTLSYIKAPWKQWEKEGKLFVVDDVEIHPEYITECIYQKGRIYTIDCIYLDNFRYTLLKSALEEIGFSTEKKNVKLIRGNDIIKVVPVIDSCFVNQYFVWGDNPVLRWAANNTKLIRLNRKPCKTENADIGNYTYGKIEAKSRKNDSFMALTASMVGEVETRILPRIGKISVIKI